MSIYKITRRVSGSPGSPASLLSGQIAYNMVDGYFYVGYGDNGSGTATSIKVFAKDDFNVNRLIPVGGSSGQILTKTSGTDYAVGWSDAPDTGIVYEAGEGITIDEDTISIDDTVVVTVTALTAALADYAELVHTHVASDITSGTFDAARIPSLDASKIGSGTIDAARLPASVFASAIVSTGAISDLDSGQQAAILEGSSVVTTDGRYWMYKGSGSKTSEASYIELGDKTPEWSVIANKPTFADVATSGSYDDLDDKPTLGTISAQDADDVAITGGTIENIILDGGPF